MREDMTLGRPNLAGRTSGSYVSGVGMCLGSKEAIRRTKASTQILLVVGPFSTKGTDRFHQRAALRPLTPQALTAMSGKVGYEGCQPAIRPEPGRRFVFKFTIELLRQHSIPKLPAKTRFLGQDFIPNAKPNHKTR